MFLACQILCACLLSCQLVQGGMSSGALSEICAYEYAQLLLLFALVHLGVPQDSDLGPMLFTMYIKPLSAIIDSHTIIHHSFTDDMQLQISAPPDRISELLHSMQPCIGDVKAWANSNMLKLKDNKTELMLVTCERTKHLHSLPASITIGNAQIPFKHFAKNLLLQ